METGIAIVKNEHGIIVAQIRLMTNSGGGTMEIGLKPETLKELQLIINDLIADEFKPKEGKNGKKSTVKRK